MEMAVAVSFKASNFPDTVWQIPINCILPDKEELSQRMRGLLGGN